MSKLNSSQELSNKLHVLLTLLEEGGVSRVLESHPLHLLDAVEEGLDDEILSNIFAPVDDERWHTNQMEAINDGPIFEDSTKYVRSALRFIDLM